jgi:hypothetical protein
MPQTTLKSFSTIVIFTIMLVVSSLALYILNSGFDSLGIEFKINKIDKFSIQIKTICILSMFWFGLLAVKKRIKAILAGLAVALVNSFSTFMLLDKIKTAYHIDLPFDVIALSTCIIMVFVLNKRYFSRIIE